MDFKELAASVRISPIGIISAQEESIPAGTKLSGFISVTEKDYIPAKASLRMTADGFISTVDFLSDDIAEIRQDPKVKSLTLSKPVYLQKSDEQNQGPSR